MAHRVFFLNRLREGVDPAAYEEWVRQTDYPLARGFPSIERYEVTRLDATLDGDPTAYHYLEVLEITSIDDYRQTLATPEFRQLVGEWSRFVASSESMHGGVIA
jgi:uncharacterized protein (TIGR02118 family)